jgi:peptidoglycan/LPS O-acetylase OafA/YrhL
MFSIALELQFYLLFPFLLKFSRRYGTRYYFALVAFLIVIRAAVYLLTGTAHHLGYFSIFGALDTFLAGVVAGGLYVGMGKREFSGWLVGLAFVALNAFVYLVHAQPSFFHFDFNGVTTDQVSRNPLWIVWPTVQGAMFAGFALLYLRSSLRLPFSDAFAWLGKISYSLYAWHTIVCLMAVKLHLHFLPPYEFGLLAILPVTIALSTASYYLIERPFLDLRVKYTRPLVKEPELQRV